MKKFEVLGSGCANCRATAELIEDTARNIGTDIVVKELKDIQDIARYGVMSTPGVAIDNKLVHAGGVPDRKTVESWFS